MMTVQRIAIVAIVVGAILTAIVLASGGVWLWGVLVEYVQPKTATERKDLVNVFVIIAAGVVGLLTAIAALGNLYFSRRNLQQQRDLDNRRAQDDALQSYFEQMGKLLAEQNLMKTNTQDNPLRLLARAQTLTVLGRLDARRKGHLTSFLYGARLIHKDNTIINLGWADLRAANLRAANLSFAELYGADLREANLNGADFSGAKLYGAMVTDEQLSSCESLEGTTMPNGQKYEDWRKSKGRGEDDEDSGTS
jgi:uncharacterized protein YjbI with pentapeptide repeats